MSNDQRPGTRLKDRPEYREKPKPLTADANTSVAEAVGLMSEKNFGSIVVVDPDNKVVGIATERDGMIKIVNRGKDPSSTKIGDIMTKDPRLARETDDVLDWLRIMSNERFRRLPVVDTDGRITALFTQGDFVSYTWPDLAYQARQLARATISRNRSIFLILGGIILYTVVVIAALGAVIASQN